jgi:hypothetical protein
MQVTLAVQPHRGRWPRQRRRRTNSCASSCPRGLSRDGTIRDQLSLAVKITGRGSIAGAGKDEAPRPVAILKLDVSPHDQDVLRHAADTEGRLARIMHYAALFCTSGELARADIPSGGIGVR